MKLTDYESVPPGSSCYHCHGKPPTRGSVFCPDCKPESGSMPVITHEPDSGEEWRTKRSLKWWLSVIFSPQARCFVSDVKLHRCQNDLADCEVANLALRKKCADLKAQRDAAIESFNQAVHDGIARQMRDDENMRSISAMWREMTEQRDRLKAQLESLQSDAYDRNAEKPQ